MREGIWRDNPAVWHDQFPLKVAYSIPEENGVNADRRYPMLCFLHGDKECAPCPSGEVPKRNKPGKPIAEAMSNHGPLADSSAPIWREKFIIVCPQLPYPGGDVWKEHYPTVLRIVEHVHSSFECDSDANYLTGFSYGGNGVFHFGTISNSFRWKALWAVDPPLVPVALPQYGTWLSAGQFARNSRDQFLKLGFVEDLSNSNSNYVYHDYGVGHGDTATQAYGDTRVYGWMSGSGRIGNTTQIPENRL